MKYSIFTLRVRIIGLVCGVILITTLAVLLMVKYRVESTFLRSYDTYSKNLVNYLNLSVANQYKSIQFHKQSVLDIRKTVLKEQTEIVISILEKYDRMQRQGVLTLSEAKQRAAKDISVIRYGGEVGYFWINDIKRPYPTMIMHPTLPELDGEVLDDERFNCALGIKENLFKAFVDVCMEYKEGYVDYMWPKPTSNGLTNDQPKLSYVALYEPWNWIIGTGIYIDDIEQAVKLRINAVINELNESVRSIDDNENDYVFIFSDDKKLLVHPFLKKHEILDITNSLSGNTIFEDFKAAKQQNKDYIEYNWLRANDTANYIYRKRAYFSYFEPLRWYIVSAYYTSSIKYPINHMVRQIAFFVGLLLLFALIVSIILANSVTKPIYELSKLVVQIEKQGIPNYFKPIKGSIEIVKFSKLLEMMISSINNTQQELIENKEKLRTYVQFAPDPVFVIDAKGNIINSNKQAEKLFNKTEAELAHLNFTDVLDENEIKAFDDILEKIEREYSAEGELKIRTCDKHIVYTLFSGALLMSKEIICFLKNISELKQYQKDLYDAKEKAEESNRLKSAFLANMSHEIRTPMNGVVGFTQLISDPELSNDERMRFAEIISKSTMQLLDVVNDIIDISRIETGQIVLNESFLMIKDFLKDIYEAYEPIANQKGIELQLELKNINSSRLLGDATKLRQIITNLLNNAIKFTDKGTITLGCSFCNFDGVFYVKDTGVGLSKGDIEIIFDRFTQANSSQNRGGTGLGLSISKAYVELMNGEFWVESELGKGTTFFFKIPFKIPYV